MGMLKEFKDFAMQGNVVDLAVVSHAASISACHIVLPCPNIVAANTLFLYFVLNKSAAFKKTAHLSS